MMNDIRRKLLEQMRKYQQDLKKALFFDAEEEIRKHREFLETHRMPEHPENYITTKK